MDLLDRLIIEADPARAAAKEAQDAASRNVVFWGHRDGGIDVTARMDVLDAKYLEHTLDQLAEILQTESGMAGWTKQALRAKALGIVAIPAVALAMQQEVLQPELISHAQCEGRQGDETVGVLGMSGALGVVDPETGRIDRDPHHCVGHVCGRVVVAPSKLMPRAKVYLHIDATDLTRLGGAVFVEKAGWPRPAAGWILTTPWHTGHRVGTRRPVWVSWPR